MREYITIAKKILTLVGIIGLFATLLILVGCSSEIQTDQKTSSNSTLFGDDLESLFRDGYNVFEVTALPARPTVGVPMEFQFEGFDTDTAVVAYECTADPNTLEDPEVFNPDEFSLYTCASFNSNELNNNTLARTLNDVGLTVHLFLFLVREQQGETTGRYAGSTIVDVQPAGGGNSECERPGPNNTGPTGNLTTISRDEIHTRIRNGERTFEDFDIQGRVVIQGNTAVDGLTFRNFKINAQGGPYGIYFDSGTSGHLLEDGEIFDMTAAGIAGHGFTARRLEIHESGHDGVKPASNSIIICNWIHHLGAMVGAHADGVQITAGIENVIISHNTIDVPDGLAGYHGANAAVIITNGEAPPLDGIDNPPRNILIEGNLLNGGKQTIYVRNNNADSNPNNDNDNGPPENVTIKDNRFGRDHADNGGIFSTDETVVYCASGNVWDDTNEEVFFNNSSSCE